MAHRHSLIISPPGKHTATVFFLHGLGDTGHGWSSAVQSWRRRQRLDQVKFVLPHAPPIPITCNGGVRMPGWFDIVTLDGTVEALIASEDEAGMLKSRDWFNGLIKAEMDAGIPADRIVIGGFSQGGAVATLTALTSSVKLAGVVGLSSWLVLSGKVKGMIKDANKDTPFLLGHGDEDPLVRPELGEMSLQVLKSMGVPVKMKKYKGMGHSACPEEMDDVEQFLNECIPAR